MATITVTHQAGDQFGIAIRGHEVVVDQTRQAGGEDAGPSPTELFVASLASCVGFYAVRFLRRHEQPYDGLTVDCHWAMRAAERARVSRLELTVATPAPVPDELQEPLRAAMEHCTVHNTLLEPPPVTVSLTGASVAAGQPGS